MTTGQTETKIQPKIFTAASKIMAQQKARKTFVAFLIACILLGQGQPLMALAGYDQNSSAENFVTKSFTPKQTLLAADNQFPLNWINQDQALKTDLNSTDPVSQFTEQNSAILVNGYFSSASSSIPVSKSATPSTTTSSQISAFADTVSLTELPPAEPNASSTTENLPPTSDAEESNQKNLENPKINLAPLASSTPSLATSSAENVFETSENKNELPEKLSSASTTPTPEDPLPGPEAQFAAPLLEYNKFYAEEKKSDFTTDSKPASAKIFLSFASQPINNGQLVVEYALGNSAWQTLASSSLTEATDNTKREGYFFSGLPDTVLASLDELHIRLKIWAPEKSWKEISDSQVFFLDGIWLEANYKVLEKNDEELSQMQLPELTPEQFAHLDFFTPLAELFMPSDLSANPISVGAKNKTANVPMLQMLPLGVSTNTPATRQGQTILYSDAYKATDLEYQLKDTGLKENIILKNKAHPAKFRYLLNANQYDVIQTSPSQIEFYQKGHKGSILYKKFALTAPIMTDANNASSDKLIFQLKGNLVTLIPDQEWLSHAAYPVIIDPSVDLSILNVSSFPVAGEYWSIGFTTVGEQDLVITPGDQATIDDMEFSSLTCDGGNVAASVQNNGQVSAPNWSCDGIGKIKFFDKKTGHHHMIFNFGGVTQDAYNGANVWNGNAGDSNWATGGNWSLGTPPGAADDVVINTASTVNLNSAAAINSLTIGISGGGTASVLNFNYDAIGGSPLAITGDLTVYGSANITHTVASSTSASAAAIIGTINLTVGGNATIVGSINADAKGYSMSHGPGTPNMVNSNNGTGASHGGIGSKGDGAQTGSQGAAYGSSTAPTTLGSGGGKACGLSGTANDIGLWGGGAIKLNVTGTTTVSGTISATGSSSNPQGSCWNPGSGSGGSVYIITGKLAGAGTVSANGGSGTNISSGGGGRVAVYYTTDSSTISFQAYGGSTRSYSSIDRYAGAGTVFKKSAAQTYGTLTVSNNNYGSTDDNVFGLTPIINTSTFDSITISNSGYLNLNSSSTTISSTTSLTISSNSLYEAASGTTLSYGSLSWSGVILDSGGSFAVINQNQDLTIPAGGKLVLNVPNATRTYNNLTVNGTFTHTPNTTATSGTLSLYKLDVTVTGDLTIGAAGSINADAKGYAVSRGPGTPNMVNSNNGTGASHGGIGSKGDGAQTGSQGAAYGSSTAPTTLGSGGGKACGNSAAAGDTGLWGGGAIKLNVTGTTTVSGTISATGSSSEPVDLCWNPGSGSGGSVYIITGKLAGAGTVSANGGSGTNISSGGGGRVAVYYTTDSSTISFQAYGGSTRISGSADRYAGAGTVFKKSAAQTYGSLTINNNAIGGSDESVLGLTPIITTTTLDTFLIDNSAYVYLSSASTTLASTTSLTISNNGSYEAASGTTLSYGSLSWSGVILDSGGSFAVINQNQDLTIPAGGKLVLNVPNATRTYNNLTVNGTFTHTPNTTATSGTLSLYKLDVTVTGDLTIGAAGSINANGKGYIGGQGPGAGAANNKAGGGGYGGAGGNGLGGGAGGSTYGSSTSPTNLGSGGGYASCGTNVGGNGGGAIKLNVTGTTTVSGSILANGNDGNNACWNSGGGSGGSIILTTGTLAGSGSIQAKGGNGISGASASGSGGGGRIALLATTNLTSIARNVSGGNIIAGTAAGTGSLYPADSPTISTQSATDNITGTSVTGNGTIDSINYYPISQYGHVWATWSNPYIPNINMIDSVLGGTATSSKSNQGAAINAFDTSTSTFWASDQGVPYDLEYDFPVNTAVNKYIVYNYNTASDAPKDWQFQAWNGSTWVNLQSITSQTGWSNYESRAFTLVNTTPYPKYRLYISANNGGGWTRISELQMINTDSAVLAKGATTTPGAFTSAITGLSPNTTYYTRAYATTPAGTVYGNEISFSTGAANNAPSAPSSLGPNYFVSNLWTATNTPTFTFTLSDPDLADTVKYNIILDNDSNFSSPLINYTSALQAQGATSFTVGQAAGGGSYSFGSAGQILPDSSSYYWKVQTIDSTTASSAYSLANSGSIAFKVDTTSPSPGTIDFYSVNPQSISLSPLNASDSGSGISTYLFSNITDSSSSGPAASNFWNNTGLTPNTTYSYTITISDALNFSSTTPTSSVRTLANVPASPTTTVISNSSILLSWDNNLNPPGTEYYAENSTSAFNSGWITSTSTLFTGLSCGTSYSFHVRAKNASGTITSYSSLVSPSASPCNNNPNSPSSLGSSQYINGGWTNQANPGLNFTLSDSDASDTLKYRIQISTTSNFTGLIVDYTSPLLSQGGKTFTVGQATSTGTYTIGFAGQTLSDTSTGYYWRVMATDNSNATSSWTTANSGNVAFKLDTVAPTAGTLSLASYTTDAVTLSFTGGADTDSGLGLSPYSYYNTTNWNVSGSTAATTWTNSGLTAGTYSYKVRVTDAAGNYTETPMSGSVTVTGNGGGGGNPWDGSSTEGFSVFVNQNDSLTNTNNVTLQLTGQPGTSQMMISNLSNFSGASQENYATTKSWDICQGLGSCTNGTYTVYAKFYNASNQSSGTVSDSITYQVLNTLVPGTISSTAVSTSSVSVLIAGSSDATYGLAANPYTFVNRTTNGRSATSSVSSWINTSLSPNTQYSYYAIVGNANSDFGITPDISVYTLANSPTNLTTSTITSTAIGFTWQANSNPAGTEYQILNQTTNTSSSWITSTSTTVTGLTCATAYAFKVKARNANGTETSYSPLISQSTSDCQANPTVPPSGGGGGGIIAPTGTVTTLLLCPAAADGKFTECFYNSKDFSSLAAVGTTAGINYDWGTNSPAPGINSNNFSARWEGNFNFEKGAYEFTAIGDDGIKIYIDGQIIINQWHDQSASIYKKIVNLTEGSHLIQMDYYEHSGHAVAKLAWQKNKIISPDKTGRMIFSGLTATSVSISIQYAAPDLLPEDTLQFFTNLTTGETATAPKNQKSVFLNLRPNTSYLFKAVVADKQGRQFVIPNARIRTLDSKPAPPPPLPPQSPTNSTTPVIVTPANPTGTVQPPSSPSPAITPPENPTPLLPEDSEINPVESILNFGHGALESASAAGTTILKNSRIILLAVSQPLISLGGTMQKIKNSPRTAVGISALTIAPASLYLEFSLASQGLSLNAAGSIADIWLKFLQWLYALLTMLGLRSKRRYWGTAYDSESKQPLDPVIVELVDQKTGKTLEQNITDMHGRFGFLDRPGTFVIRATKTNYRFPSQNILGQTDLMFDNLYHGEPINITAEGEIITPNIPMDPMAFDWNQMDKQRIVKINPRFEYALHIILQTLFWSGAIFVLLNFLLKTDLFNSIATIVYITMIILRKMIPHAHLWGRIVFKDGRQAKDLLLELHPVKIPDVVTGRAITAASGKFFLKAMPGNYILSVKKITGDSNQVLYKQDVTVDKNGVVNEVIHL